MLSIKTRIKMLLFIMTYSPCDCSVLKYEFKCYSLLVLVPDKFLVSERRVNGAYTQSVGIASVLGVWCLQIVQVRTMPAGIGI